MGHFSNISRDGTLYTSVVCKLQNKDINLSVMTGNMFEETIPCVCVYVQYVYVLKCNGILAWTEKLIRLFEASIYLNLG